MTKVFVRFQDKACHRHATRPCKRKVTLHLRLKELLKGDSVLSRDNSALRRNQYKLHDGYVPQSSALRRNQYKLHDGYVPQSSALRRNQYKLHDGYVPQSSESTHKACDPRYSPSLFCFFRLSDTPTRCVRSATDAVDTRHPDSFSLSMTHPTTHDLRRGHAASWNGRCARSNGT